MADLAKLSQAIATLQDMALRYCSESQSAEWRREYLADRRLAFQAITDLATAGRMHLLERGDDTLLRRFDDNIARFRHTLALHQANWPVVSINLEDLDYLHSRQVVRSASREVAKLINEIMASPQLVLAAK